MCCEIFRSSTLLQYAMEIILLTFRASSRLSGPFFLLPGVVAAFTFKHPGLVNDAIIAAFDINRFAIDQGIGNCLSALLDDPSEGGP